MKSQVNGVPCKKHTILKKSFQPYPPPWKLRSGKGVRHCLYSGGWTFACVLNGPFVRLFDNTVSVRMTHDHADRGV
jgi:hypothetical protein